MARFSPDSGTYVPLNGTRSGNLAGTGTPSAVDNRSGNTSTSAGQLTIDPAIVPLLDQLKDTRFYDIALNAADSFSLLGKDAVSEYSAYIQQLIAQANTEQHVETREDESLSRYTQNARALGYNPDLSGLPGMPSNSAAGVPATPGAGAVAASQKAVSVSRQACNSALQEIAGFGRVIVGIATGVNAVSGAINAISGSSALALSMGDFVAGSDEMLSKLSGEGLSDEQLADLVVQNAFGTGNERGFYGGKLSPRNLVKARQSAKDYISGVIAGDEFRTSRANSEVARKTSEMSAELADLKLSASREVLGNQLKVDILESQKAVKMAEHGLTEEDLRFDAQSEKYKADKAVASATIAESGYKEAMYKSMSGSDAAALQVRKQTAETETAEAIAEIRKYDAELAELNFKTQKIVDEFKLNATQAWQDRFNFHYKGGFNKRSFENNPHYRWNSYNQAWQDYLDKIGNKDKRFSLSVPGIGSINTSF